MTYNTGETSEELRAKYNPEGSELRNVQMRMLDMLLYIDKICKAEGIKYRLEGGNVLGAVRHGGFIPWDDDIDIALEKKEFDRLNKYLLSHPHPQYVLQCNETDPGYYFNSWTVLRDTHSEYIQDSYMHNARKYKGVQVDIFCLDTHVNVFLLRAVNKLNAINIDYFIGRHPHLAQCTYLFQKYVAIPVAKILGYPFSSGSTLHFAYGIGFVWGWNKEVSNPTGTLNYEGYSIPGPADVDTYLKIHFGNYMELPPTDCRNHHEANYKIW